MQIGRIRIWRLERPVIARIARRDLGFGRSMRLIHDAAPAASGVTEHPATGSMLPIAGVTDRSPPPSAAERTRNQAFGSDVNAWHELRRLLEHSVDHGRVEDLPRGAAEAR